jgi:serine/threonine protein kinase
VTTAPYEPIPESTQVHVDRLLGARLGDWRVVARKVEGRLGTLYEGQHATTGQNVTLEVLRAGLEGDAQELSAAMATKNAGVVGVIGSGECPDGRRFRVMEPLEGASLDQHTKVAPREVARLLDAVAVVLEGVHAWSVVHGNLGPSSVYVSGGAARIIDFGLARKKKLSPQDDLQSLGALGFSLLRGEEVRDVPGLPEPVGDGPLERFLRELMEQRHVDASAARRELAHVALELDAVPAVVAPAVQKSRAPLVAGLVALLAIAGGAGAFFGASEAPPEAVPVAAGPVEDELELPEDLDEPEDPPPALVPDAPSPSPSPFTKKAVSKTTTVVPSAQDLYALTTKLEAQLRKQPLRYGDDVEAALFVLNKQRLRLSGSPSVEDRKEVARQLAGWKRSYLRKR